MTTSCSSLSYELLISQFLPYLSPPGYLVSAHAHLLHGAILPFSTMGYIEAWSPNPS